MDGMETLREITKTHKVPVVVVSSHSTQGATSTFKALSLGAIDFVAKPHDVLSAQMDEIGAELISKIKAAAATRMAPHSPRIGIHPRKGQESKAGTTRTADKDYCNWRFNWRPQCAPVHVVATAWRFRRRHRGRTAHARGIHRTFCAASRRVLLRGSEGSAIGRRAARRRRS